MKKLTLTTDNRENIIELIDYAKKFIKKDLYETQKNLIMKLLEFFIIKKNFGLCYQNHPKDR